MNQLEDTRTNERLPAPKYSDLQSIKQWQAACCPPAAAIRPRQTQHSNRIRAQNPAAALPLREGLKDKSAQPLMGSF